MCCGIESKIKLEGPEPIVCPSCGARPGNAKEVKRGVERRRIQLCCCLPCCELGDPKSVAYCEACKWSAVRPKDQPYQPAPAMTVPPAAGRSSNATPQSSGKW